MARPRSSSTTAGWARATTSASVRKCPGAGPSTRRSPRIGAGWPGPFTPRPPNVPGVHSRIPTQKEKTMNHQNQLIVVTGAAGQQGGAAARHLLKAGWKVRALTRDVTKPAAQALAALGAELFHADNDDRASLDAAFKGAYGVFAVQNYWLPNVGHDGEVKQGI